MPRVPLILTATLGAAGLAMAGGLPAAAQEPGAGSTPDADDVAAAITEIGWYADDESVGDREQLAAVAERLSRQSEPMGFALLAQEPPGSSTAYAEDVLDALIGRGGPDILTVVVLSDADVGVVSDVWSDRAIDEALDETIEDIRAEPADGLEALADALAAQPTGFDDEDEGTDDGGPDTGLLVLAGVGVVGIALASRALRGAGSGDPMDDESSGWGGSRWRRRYHRSSYRSSGRRSSRGGSRRRSSGGARRGRGGRRL